MPIAAGRHSLNPASACSVLKGQRVICGMATPDLSLLAVYGSLRRRSLARQGFLVLRDLRFHAHGVLRGLLFNQKGYPGVLEQPGRVPVEVYRVLTESVWGTLDQYEGYRPSLGHRSLFYRKEVTLLHPEIRAFVYFLGREIPRGTMALVSSSKLQLKQESRSCRI
jgi:gamma-glutamylcyclotransferase (GGCT)/AIG2-like uncharacterized protein YtfP